MSCARSPGSAACSTPPVVVGEVQQHVQHAGLAQPLDRNRRHHPRQLGLDRTGRPAPARIRRRAGCGSTRPAQRVRVVEDQRRRQRQARRGLEPVAQLDGGQRVEAVILERQVGSDRLRCRQAEHRRHVRAHQVEQQPVLVVGGQRRRVVADSADRDCAAASESPTCRRAGPEIRSLNIGGSVPAADLVRSAARSMRAGPGTARRRSAPCRTAPARRRTVIARMPSRLSRARSAFCRCAGHAHWPAPTAPTPATSRAGRCARRCAASASR